MDIIVISAAISSILGLITGEAGKAIIKKETEIHWLKLKKVLANRFNAKNDQPARINLDRYEREPAEFEGLFRESLQSLDIGRDKELSDLLNKFVEMKNQEHLPDLSGTGPGNECPADLHGDSGGGSLEKFARESSAQASGKLPAVVETYLGWVMRDNRVLSLEGIDPKVCNTMDNPMLLSGVYTVLFALSSHDAIRDEVKSLIKRGLFGIEHYQEAALPVVRLVGRKEHPHWVILGEPGYGKTTFVNFTALCLAGEMLGDGQANIQAMLRPIEGGRSSDKDPEPYPWEAGTLLPVKIVLRNLAGEKWLTDAGRDMADQFWNYFYCGFGHQYEGEARQTLGNYIDKNGALVMLDGLDETPEKDRVREGIKKLVDSLASSNPKLRIIITSRTYAYQNPLWQIPGIPVAVLTRFSNSQIRVFINQWYRHAVLQGRVEEKLAGIRIQALSSALFKRQSSLLEIARSPLLLTQLASLHAFKGGQLPEQRAKLYEASVDLLMDVWEDHKQKGRGEVPGEQKNLGGYMDVSRGDLKQALEKVAFDAHYKQMKSKRDQSGVADISEDRLLLDLMSFVKDPDVKPRRLAAFLSCRAGLVVDRGEGVYSFPHRTFQEHMAACYLTKMDDEYETLVDLVKQSPNHWRETALLAAAKIHGGGVTGFWYLINELCPESVKEFEGQKEPALWPALIAGMAVAESVDFEKVSGRLGKKLIPRVKDWMRHIMSGNELPAVERAAAGDGLAVMGDPRFDPENYFLPVDDDMGFVTIKEGVLKMGSAQTEKDRFDRETRHEVYLSEYKISRYPVTKAQYRCFARETKHPDRRFENYGKNNHPVSCVSWEDATAYCEWITRKLSSKGLHAALPTEAQWEKAARWGRQTAYPWGDEITPELANYGETPIQGTSAVGCFGHAMPENAPLDMIGNVFEWCRDRYGDYEKKPQKDPAGPDDGSSRVIRGGSFANAARNCRSASRNLDHPSNRNGYLGFRLVLLPGLSSSK